MYLDTDVIYCVLVLAKCKISFLYLKCHFTRKVFCIMGCVITMNILYPDFSINILFEKKIK